MTAQLHTSPIPESGLDPLDPGFQRDPYPYYEWLLRNDPVHCGEEGTWYVTRYDDVRMVMSDERFGCASVRDFWEEMIGPGALKDIMRDTLFFEDDPKHGVLRSLVRPAFAPRRMRALQPEITRVVDELLAPLARRGSMELVNEFAAPLALTFVCDLLGVPPDGYEDVRRWSIDIGPTLDLVPTQEEIDTGNKAMAEFTEYLRDLISARGPDDGREDVIGVLLAASRDEKHAGHPYVSMNAIISTVISVVFAGHDTVTNQISNTMLALMRHPDQYALLRDNPNLVPNAVEESLRYDSSVQSNSRRLDVDAEIGGKLLPRGDFIVALMGAANRDPRQFDEPNRFDITRQNIKPMSFGAGMRYCLGALLGKLEIAAALERLILLDDVQLEIAEDQLAYQRSSMFRSLVQLPVSFTPVRDYASLVPSGA